MEIDGCFKFSGRQSPRTQEMRRQIEPSTRLSRNVGLPSSLAFDLPEICDSQNSSHQHTPGCISSSHKRTPHLEPSPEVLLVCGGGLGSRWFEVPPVLAVDMTYRLCFWQTQRPWILCSIGNMNDCFHGCGVRRWTWTQCYQAAL